jgi:hypothetical protein
LGDENADKNREKTFNYSKKNNNNNYRTNNHTRTNRTPTLDEMKCKFAPVVFIKLYNFMMDDDSWILMLKDVRVMKRKQKGGERKLMFILSE